MKDHDAITCLHPVVWVHSAKLRVDGITKYLENAKFVLDHAFDETCDTEQVYVQTTLPLVKWSLQGNGGQATVFAFGQTGSGKTFTMQGIQQLVANDFYPMLEEANLGNVEVFVSSFELYSGSVLDLLNNRQKLKIQENGKGEVVVSGLSEVSAASCEELLAVLESGSQMRTTHATQSNDSSSRSHAILQINIRQQTKKKLIGKLSLVDLAGSERWSDTKQHDSQRRGESAEINTSLLALKECMRALNTKAAHIPYRQSKLTMILKDCFTSSKAMTSMIATVSPGANSADHTINTLRYAEHTRAGGTRNAMPAMKRHLTRPISARPKDKDSNPPSQKENNAIPATGTKQRDLSPRRAPSQERQPAVLPKARELHALNKKREAILDLHIEQMHERTDLLEREKEIMRNLSHKDELELILDRKEAMIRIMQQAIGEYVAASKEEDDACFDSYEI